MGDVEDGSDDSPADMRDLHSGDDRLQHPHDEETAGRETLPRRLARGAG